MPISTLASNGRITLPKPVRDALGLEAGDRVQFVQSNLGFHLLPASGDIRVLRCALAGRRRAPASITDMNAAVSRAAVKKSYLRGKKQRQR